jgi:hypothetical protein
LFTSIIVLLYPDHLPHVTANAKCNIFCNSQLILGRKLLFRARNSHHEKQTGFLGVKVEIIWYLYYPVITIVFSIYYLFALVPNNTTLGQAMLALGYDVSKQKA